MSQDIVNSLQTVSYTSKDFNSIYPELLDTVKKLSYKWDPSISNESDPGVILLKLNAIIADKCNYNIDTSILECFPLSVTQQRNAHQLFEQLGYYMKWKQSATTYVTLKWIGETTYTEDAVSYTIPAFTMVTDADQKVVYTLIGITEGVSDNEFVVSDQKITTDGKTVTFKAIEGTVADFVANGNTKITFDMLDENNRLYFQNTNIAENGIFIKNYGMSNYASWEKRDNLLLETLTTDNKFFKFGLSLDTNSCFLEFPENAADIFGTGIEIKYIETNADSGNIATQILENFYVNVVPDEDTSITLSSENVKIQNPIAGTGGVEYESISDAYDNYKHTVGTFNTLITLRDYLNKVLTSELASNGFVCDRTNDVQLSYPIISIDKVGSTDTTIEVEKRTIDKNTEEFKLTLREPEDWNIGYKNYYRRALDSTTIKYTPISDSSAPAWAANTFYSLNYVEDFKLTAFSLKLYLLQYKKAPTDSSSFAKTFKMMTPSETGAVELYLEDIKSISHDFVDICGKTDTNSHFCYFVNYYPLKIDITPQYTLTSEQKTDVITNIKTAIYENLNAQELDFGDSISLNMVINTVVNSDGRIKNASIGQINYTTYAIYYDEDSDSFKSVAINSPSNWYNAYEVEIIDGNEVKTAVSYIDIDEESYLPLVGYIYGTHKIYKQIVQIDPENPASSYSNAPSDWSSNYFNYFYSENAAASGEAKNYKRVPGTFGSGWVSGTYYKKVNSRYRELSSEPKDWGYATYYYKVNGEYVAIKWVAPSFSAFIASHNGAVYGHSLSGEQWLDNGLKPQYKFDDGDWEEDVHGIVGLDILSINSVNRVEVVISNNLQFRDEIYTKSVLGGSTQFFVKDETYDYTLNQSYKNVYSDYKKIKTNVELTLGAGTNTGLTNTQKLKDNESVQLFAPNLLSKMEFSNSVKIEWILNKDVPANSDYSLSSNEQVAFYWKEDSDSSTLYSYYIYGKGAIISPSFVMAANSVDCEALNYLWANSLKYGTGESSDDPLYMNSDVSGSMTYAISEKVSQLTSAKNVLSGTKTVSIKSKNTATLNSTNCCYWILNEKTSDGYYKLFDAITNDGAIAPRTRILQSDEYFIYSNSALSEIAILGAGSSITLNNNVNEWSVKPVDYADIIENGTDALENYWYQVPTNTTLEVRENRYVTVGSNNSIKLEPTGSNTIFTSLFVTKTLHVPSQASAIIFTESTFRTKMGTSLGLNNEFTFKYSNGTWTLVGSASGITSLTDYGFTWDSTQYTPYEDDSIIVTVRTMWKLVVNSSGYTLYKCSSETESWEQVTEVGALKYFNIFYKTTSDVEWTEVSNIDFDGESWDMYALLAIQTSSTVSQKLFSDQSIVLTNSAGTSTTITGGNLTNNIYPTVILTSEDLSIAGGDTSYDLNDISIYEFKQYTDYNTGVKRGSTDLMPNKVRFKTSGDLDIQFPASDLEKETGNIYFKAFKGNYILPFSVTADDTDNYDISMTVELGTSTGTYSFSMTRTTQGSTESIGTVSFTDGGGIDLYESAMGCVDNSTYTYNGTSWIYDDAEQAVTLSARGLQYTLNSGVTLKSGDKISVNIYSFVKLGTMSDSSVQTFHYGHYYYIDMPIAETPTITTKDMMLKVTVTGSRSKLCSAAIGNVYKYGYPDNLYSLVYNGSSEDEATATYYSNKIKELIKRFDVNSKFNYVYEVPSSVALPNPMSSDSFLKTNHVYNKYTICAYDDSLDSATDGQYIKIVE